MNGEQRSICLFFCCLFLCLAAVGVSHNIWGKASEERIKQLEERIQKLEERK